jgi:predicted nucleotidyltransferase
MTDRAITQDDRRMLEAHVATLEARHAVAFAVLFGSRARGDAHAGSDYDLLVGLTGEDARRWIDRLADFEGAQPAVEVFPYARSEWEAMFHADHPLLLEALEDGIVIADDGSFARLRTVFRKWRREGRLVRRPGGWRISAAAA